MDAEDFRRLARFLGRVSSTTGKRIVMWQIPLGNTKMRAVNNTWGHYQDNRPEWFLDEPSRSRLHTYRDAGIVAWLFGGGAVGRHARATRPTTGSPIQRQSRATVWRRSPHRRERLHPK